MTAISSTVADMKAQLVVKKLHDRVITDFSDIIILSQLEKGSKSGYDIIRFVYGKYGFLMPSGTLYSMMHSLEQKGLIKGKWVRQKRVYSITEKGSETIQAVIDSYSRIRDLLGSIMVD